MKGHFVKHSEDAKKKMSESKIGIKYPNRKSPLPFSKEHRENLRKAKKISPPIRQFKKGHIPWNKNKKGVQKPPWLGKKRPELSGDKHPNWKGGKSFEPYSSDWTETLRRSIRERDNYICQLCNKPQGDIAHNVHHIDYDKQNCNPNNLITLCVNCNSRVNKNRDYWIEYFNNKINQIN